jgi:hypothetical protein
MRASTAVAILAALATAGSAFGAPVPMSKMTDKETGKYGGVLARRDGGMGAIPENQMVNASSGHDGNVGVGPVVVCLRFTADTQTGSLQRLRGMRQDACQV